MKSMHRPPFPTAIEVVRVAANAFNTKTKPINKDIDDMAFNACVDYRFIDRCIDETIRKPIDQNFMENDSEVFSQSAKELIKDYISIVSSISLDGVTREQSLPILLESLFPKYAADFLFKAQNIFGGPDPVFLLDSNDRSMKTVLGWLTEHEKGWDQFIQGCTKENKDRISIWEKGDNLPFVQSIDLLRHWSQGPWQEFINWSRVRALLLIARALDWARSQELGVVFIDAIRRAVWSHDVKNDFPDIARHLQYQGLQHFSEALPVVEIIQDGLLRTSAKKFSDKEKLIQNIRKARKILNRLDRHSTTDCWLDWHEARWNVFSGDLERACECYKLAFDGSLYRSGEHQKIVIEECLVVAAALKHPDLVFLKRLKNMAITLGYDIPSVAGGEMSGSNKASDFIEDWEVENWAAHLNSVFPKEGLFPGTKLPSITPRKGPLLLFDCDAIKPDFRYPDRTIKVGETWQKSYPQIVWFSKINKVDVVKKLLKKGADVNVYSDSKDTPIIIALQAVNAFLDSSTMDDSLLRVLLEYKHKPETLNTCTSKERILPLICAVESGRVEVVQKLLEMGADPNRRGNTDEQTPLYVCLTCIAKLKQPDKYWQFHDDIALTPEILDSIRRQTGGLAGFTLEDQNHFLECAKNHPLFNMIMVETQSFIYEKAKTHITVKSLREIALLLLKSGADPNAEHTSPIPGYTPMMLAAELDEADVFLDILNHRGDPKKGYSHPITGATVDCFEISHYFDSEAVGNILYSCRS